MRFDDRLETALAIPADGAAALDAQWRQLLDILARHPQNFPADRVARGLARARELITLTKPAMRLQSIRNMGGRISSAPLVHLLAYDRPIIAAAIIASARLDDAQWADLIPRLPSRARGFLRNRTDLGPRAQRALIEWAGADFILPQPEMPNDSINAMEAAVSKLQFKDRQSPQSLQSSDKFFNQQPDIGILVERIETLRREREITPPATDHTQQASKKATEIRFETDDQGLIHWSEGGPEGAIVGIGIAEPAFDGEPGTDAYGAASFRQRLPIENVRLLITGSPVVAGDWRMNAVPFFDSASGRFRGYRGVMRRPDPIESAAIEAEFTDQARSGEQMQQLIHELRTPLGAIVGFAEIIEQQLFGPVSHDYRVLARSIIDDANRMLAGFDDLSDASRLDRGHMQLDEGITEVDWLTLRLAERLTGLSEKLGITLNLAKADPVRPFSSEPAVIERIFSRLISAVMIGCSAGETLDGRLRTELGTIPLNIFELTLPQRLCGMSATELLGSGPGTLGEGDDAPLLGLGFSLRLVRSLARNINGDLRFEKERLLLTLPALRDSKAWHRGNER